MAFILNIDTATDICSASLSLNGQVVAARTSEPGDQNHASQLTVFIQEIFNQTQTSARQLNAVSVSKGPGSFTGLRIGVSTAKGIAYGADKPLLAVGTLDTMACQVAEKLRLSDPTVSMGTSLENTILCPMIDARRMEVYYALFNADGSMNSEVKAEIITENSFTELLESKRVLFFGNGAAKCKSTLLHPNAYFIENITPSASAMSVLSEIAFLQKDFVDVAYFEPFYLKDFIATVPKNKVF
jgi:tRNA threonylcarbamoyladenosine biosynthesis protein TsaB